MHFGVGKIMRVVLAIALFFMAKDAIMRMFSKEVKTEATLVSKFVDDYVDKKMYATSNGVEGGVAEKGKTYYETFEMADGKRITFAVSKDRYDVALEGASGVLVFKYRDLISFKAETEGTKDRPDTTEAGNYFVSLKDKM